MSAIQSASATALSSRGHAASQLVGQAALLGSERRP